MSRLIKEDAKGSEEVIAYLRKEGDVARPEDTQCQAVEDGERCESSITYDMVADCWVKFCQSHLEQDNAARDSGEKRVERIST